MNFTQIFKNDLNMENDKVISKLLQIVLKCIDSFSSMITEEQNNIIKFRIVETDIIKRNNEPTGKLYIDSDINQDIITRIEKINFFWDQFLWGL